MTIQLNTSAQAAKSWPFVEARALYEHVTKKGKKAGDMVTFETGYGPSGPPHIGTFGEVVRTSMVRYAFDLLTNNAFNTRLLVVSDDYDGFRKVPDGLPESMKEHLGLPLSQVPDPDGQDASFAHANNRKLVEFVDSLGIDYEFISASEMYQGGHYDSTLRAVYENHQAILDIMLPTLGAERQASYCAFMPISLTTGHVLATGAQLGPNRNIIYDEGIINADVSIYGGQSKLQWKVDWPARWLAFDVDYEMSGKDLIDSVKVSTKICRVLGGTPPLNMTYELFVDEEGKKISKSKGNGVAMEEWFRYGSKEALALFMFQNPRAAKTLALNVIPRVTDEYLKGLASYQTQTDAQRLDNPVHHIHNGDVPEWHGELTYGLMVNLTTSSNTQDKAVLLNYANQYIDSTEFYPEGRAIIDSMAGHVLNYVKAVLPAKTPRAPTTREARAFRALALRLLALEDGLDAETYQYEVYETGKEYQFDPLRGWFQALYQVIFGDEQGPRFGTFVAAYGRTETIELLERAAAREGEA